MTKVEKMMTDMEFEKRAKGMSNTKRDCSIAVLRTAFDEELTSSFPHSTKKGLSTYRRSSNVHRGKFRLRTTRLPSHEHNAKCAPTFGVLPALQAGSQSPH